MTDEKLEKQNYAQICIKYCNGSCCDPWWGVIFFPITFSEKALRYGNAKQELLKNINARIDRIKEAYVTSETDSRTLFQDPIKYNVAIDNIKQSGANLIINLRAMFAFKCLFLSDDKSCLIHPEVINSEIRPPHCKDLGNPNAKQGEKGYCRIVNTAIKTSFNDESIISAVEQEKNISNKYFNDGHSNINDSVNNIYKQITQYFQKPANTYQAVGSNQKINRNAPCSCGSGLKYKKCHGK